jgi:hypothetical protein
MAFSLMGAMSMSCTTLVSNEYTIVLSTKQKVVCGWKNEANVPNNNNGAEQSPGTCLAKGNTCKQVLWDDRSKQICDVGFRPRRRGDRWLRAEISTDKSSNNAAKKI